VVSKYPKIINRNRDNDLHSSSEQAVIWGSSSIRTNFDCYYINGRNIPKKYFDSINSNMFTVDDFLKETNEEIKSTCVAMMQELYGDNYVVDFFRKELIEINTYVDKKDSKYLEGTTGGMNVGVYTLFKGEINGIEIAYIRCYCPSTDRLFFLGVESKHINAKDAIASLYRVPKSLKSHIKYISRQGERFATVFTEEGKKKVEKLKKEELSDLISISGDDYFKKITYEF
jgi:hypothetical protein